MTQEISNSDDMIDVRDVIARYEELRELEARDDDENAELVTLTELLDELKGNGGDEQWLGSWYPITLIRDSYFEDYARELADDLGLIKDDAGWPANCIDWEQAARELRIDYSSCELDGVTYWYR